MNYDRNLPVHLSAEDAAILAFVRDIPERWQEIDFDQMTSAEQTALLRLAIMDVCLLRATIRVTSPLGQAMVVCDIGGLYQDLLNEVVRGALPRWWLDQPLGIRADKPIAVKSSGKMEAVRRDFAAGRTKHVLRWLKDDLNAAAPRCRVQSCEVQGSPSCGGQNIAAAQATIGDIVIHNHVPVPEQPAAVAPSVQPDDKGELSVPEAPSGNCTPRQTIRLSAGDAATYIGLSPRQMTNWIREHKIYAEPYGHQYDFDRWELNVHRDLITKKKHKT